MQIEQLAVGERYVAWTTDTEPGALDGTAATGWVLTVTDTEPSLEPYNLPAEAVLDAPVLCNVDEVMVISFKTPKDMAEMLALQGRKVPDIGPDTSPDLRVIRSRTSIMPAAMIRMPLATWLAKHPVAATGV